jgi:hypothetical protein
VCTDTHFHKTSTGRWNHSACYYWFIITCTSKCFVLHGTSYHRRFQENIKTNLQCNCWSPVFPLLCVRTSSTSASCPARTLEAYVLVPLTPHNTPSGVRFDSPDMVAPTCKTYFGYWSSLWLLLLVASPNSCCTHNLEEWKKLSSSPLEDLISITTAHDQTVSTLLRFNSVLGRFGRKPLFENLMCVGIDEAGGENIRLDQLCQS